MSTTPTLPAPSTFGISGEATFEVEIFYDGGCSLCAKEIALMRWLDRGRGKIRLTDIAGPGFDAEKFGTTYEDLMVRIHGRLPDGVWIEGVEVFRRAYAAIGLRWLMPLTRLPGIRHLLDAGYVRFARWRYRRRCDSGTCPLPPPSARSTRSTPGAAPPTAEDALPLD